MYSMYFFIFQILLIKLAYCDESDNNLDENYPNIMITPRKTQVFEFVPMYTLNSKGLQLKTDYRGYILCENETEGATFMPIKCNGKCPVGNDTDTSLYTGVFGNSVLQTIVNKGKKRCWRSRKHVVDSKSENSTSQYIHQSPRPGFYAYREINPEDRQRHMRHKRMDKMWNQLTIKLLVVIDNALFNKFDRDHQYIAQYMQIFWSAVELKFRNITQPKINLNLTSIIVVEEKNVLKYTELSLKGQPQTINMGLALDNFEEIKGYFHNISMPDYDIIVTITGSNGVVLDNYMVSSCQGIAFREGVCLREKYNGIIIQDDTKYSGIKNAVHEVAHILGLRHDGDEVIEDDIDYSKCDFEFRKPGECTIMQPIVPRSYDRYVWSSCSLGYFDLLPRYAHVSCVGSM